MSESKFNTLKYDGKNSKYPIMFIAEEKILLRKKHLLNLLKIVYFSIFNVQQMI